MSIEEENLQAHVAICAERHKTLISKIDQLSSDLKLAHNRINQVKESVVEHKDQSVHRQGVMNKLIITISLTVIAILGSGIFTLIQYMQ